MEKLWSCRGGWLLCGFFMLSFLICSTSADDDYEKKYHPTKNVNLTPFMQYLSVYQCMLNHSSSCQPNYNLTANGWPNVSYSDAYTFCHKGCAEHTIAVLECIFLVKRDYKFSDKRTVHELNHTITQGCINGVFPFNSTIPLPNGAIRESGRAGFVIIFSVVAVVLLAYSHI